MKKKKIYYTTNQQLEGLRWVAKVTNFGLGIMVKSAMNELFTAYIMLRDRKELFRHTVKQRANLAMRKSEAKERLIFQLMENRKFYDDYSDSVIDYAQNDITLFMIAMKQELDKHEVEYSDLFAQMETARALLDMCCKNFKYVMEDARMKYGKDFSSDFREFDMSEIHAQWSVACNLLFERHTKGKVVDVNTENVKRLFCNLYKKFVNGEYVDKCLRVAQENNPEFVENDIEVIS